MLSNFRSQLETAGLSHRYDELLHEVARVRAELAFPIMITPFAQFVGTQAVLNMMSGDRYSVVPNEIKKYALGHYGTLMAPIEPELLKRIVANGASNIAPERMPIPPMLPDLRARYPQDDIDALLLRAMFAGTQVDEMQKAKAAGLRADESARPLLGLIKSLYEKSGVGARSLTTPELHISLTRGNTEHVV